MRQFTGTKLLIGSNNDGKIKEIKKLLSSFNIEILTIADFNLIEPEETEDTFEGNAILKASNYTNLTKIPSLADDSGLVVPAINDQPGIYSARWAGPDRNFQTAINKLEQELQDKADRSAYFICALALAWPDNHIETFTGQWDGHLTFPAKGENGFGYDLIFIPEGYNCTVAEMHPHEKQALSHRTQAFKKLVNSCFLN